MTYDTHDPGLLWAAAEAPKDADIEDLRLGVWDQDRTRASRELTEAFEASGYFCTDEDSAPSRPVFNRTVTLRDTWAKIAKRQSG